MKKNAVIGIVGCLVSVIACNDYHDGAGKNSSEVNIVGGHAAGKNQFPAVVKLIVDEGTDTTHPKICTGVIMSHRTVLAAAHCVKVKAEGNNLSYYSIAIEESGTREKIEISSDKIHTFTQGISKEKILTNAVVFDLAVLDFGANTFALDKYPKIRLTAPALGDGVTLVGFGATTFDEDSDLAVGELNTGTNVIREYDSQSGYLKLTGTVLDDGSPTGALAGPGDSGGPLFDAQGNIVGIGSGFYIDGNSVTNFYVDLTSQEAKYLLGRYLQDVPPSEGELVLGFNPQMATPTQPVPPRLSAGAVEITAMCGGGKGKKNKKKRDRFSKSKGKSKSKSTSKPKPKVIAEGSVTVVNFSP